MSSLASEIWAATIPLLITHPLVPNSPYLLTVPRLSYLPLLLPRLYSFFGETATSFEYEGIPLKNLPVGLLADLYQPELPFRLSLGTGALYDIRDTFVNSVKEADFVRNGTAKGIMSMSKENSTAMWNAVVDHDFRTFTRINTMLLNPATPLRHIPLRIYIPSALPSTAPHPSSPSTEPAPLASFKIVQSLVPPYTERREAQTLGSALNSVLPTLFPSRRDAILAEPILHGARLPFRAVLEEVMRECAYADGWVHLGVLMVDA